MVCLFGKSIVIRAEKIGVKEISGRWSQNSSCTILNRQAKSIRPGTEKNLDENKH